MASDIFGVSGRQMMAALIGGERDPKVLAQLARSRTRAKIGPLEEAFNGHFDNHHAFLLTGMLGRIDAIDAEHRRSRCTNRDAVGPFRVGGGPPR